MIRLSPSILDAMPHLTERQQAVVRMRLDGTPCRDIAAALGIHLSGVSVALRRALSLSSHAAVEQPRKRVYRTRMGKPIDAAWYERQVAYVRSLEHGPAHQGAYMRGIAMCQGATVADEVERRVKG